MSGSVIFFNPPPISLVNGVVSTNPLALVVGNEGKGISRLVREHLLIKLPMRGQINSLNAAVTGSIALYEALRQREKGGIA